MAEQSSQLGPRARNLRVSPVTNILRFSSAHRRMNSSGLSTSGSSDAGSVGEGDELVGSGIFGVGSGSSEHPASRTGTVMVSASARRTCMKCLPENNVSTGETTHSGGF
jgi:hypothetical protein